MNEIKRYRRGLETCPQANLAKSGRAIFFFFFRRVRATSMTQRGVENFRVHFWTFSPVSIKLKNSAEWDLIGRPLVDPSHESRFIGSLMTIRPQFGEAPFPFGGAVNSLKNFLLLSNFILILSGNVFGSFIKSDVSDRRFSKSPLTTVPVCFRLVFQLKIKVSLMSGIRWFMFRSQYAKRSLWWYGDKNFRIFFDTMSRHHQRYISGRLVHEQANWNTPSSAENFGLLKNIN